MFSGLFGYSFSGSRLFPGSQALSRKKPATIRQQPATRATNRQQPLAICAAGVREASRSGRAAFRQPAKTYSDTLQSTETTGGSGDSRSRIS